MDAPCSSGSQKGNKKNKKTTIRKGYFISHSSLAILPNKTSLVIQRGKNRKTSKERNTER
jgi:hypothetical protein